MFEVYFKKDEKYNEYKYSFQILIERIGIIPKENIEVYIGNKVQSWKQIAFSSESSDIDVNYLTNEGLILPLSILDSIVDSLSCKTETQYELNSSHCISYFQLNAEEKLKKDIPYIDFLTERIKMVFCNYFISKNIAFTTYNFWDTPTILLSHDVDGLNGKSVTRYLYWLLTFYRSPVKNLKKIWWWILQKEDYYNNILQIIKFEKSLGFRSTFFFMALKYYITIHEGRRYSIENKKVISLIRKVKEEGWEVGLHPSRKSFNNFKQLFLEWSRLQKIVPSISGIRRHYLKGTFPEIWQQSILVGAQYDATCGFTRYPGFRVGTARPFFAFDYSIKNAIDVIEIPLVIMDITISARSEEEYFEKFLDRQELSLSSGILSVNWHNELYCNEIFSLNWKDIYEKILIYWKEKNYRVLSIELFLEEYAIYSKSLKNKIKWIV